MELSKAFLAIFALMPFIIHAEVCDYGSLKGDVVFLLDSSSSINDTDFDLALGFVKDFAASVTVGPNNVRIAVVLYAYGASVEFNFTRYNSSQEIQTAVDGIRRTWGATSTYKGLQTIHNDIFGSSKNARSDVKRSIVLITDGESNNPNWTRAAAQSLRDDGVEILTIGIGGYIDSIELIDVASSRLHFIYLKDFQMLTTTTDAVLKIICHGCNITEIKADVVFILDSSSSISEVNFQKMLQFVKNFTNAVRIGPDYVREGVLKFAFEAYIEFDIDKYVTAQETDNAIDRIKQTYGGTETDTALAKVHNNSSIVYGNTRPNVRHLVILITDGLWNNKGATELEAKRLRDDGVEIAVIGITDQINKDELLRVASSKDHIFSISDFSVLPSLINKLLLVFCKDTCATPTRSSKTSTDSIILGPPDIVG